MKKGSTILILIIIFALSLFVRLYKLDQTPNSLTWDETSLGYNAYSLLVTGKDEYGTKMPLVLRSFDDYKPALYAYLSIPFIKIFGLNIFSIRLLSALVGAGTVLSLYFLVKNLSKNNLAALTAAFICMGSPLLLLYSRMALEANLSLFLFITGLAFLFKSPSTKNYISSLLFLLFSSYAYHSPRYIVPLIIVVYLFSLRRSKNIKSLLLSSFVFGVLYIPIVSYILSPVINTRFKETSIITNSNILFGSIANLYNTPLVFSTISRAYFYLLDFVGRYLAHFNPYQLFIYTTGNPSYRVDGVGVFSLFDSIFWFAGIYYVIKNIRQYWLIIFLCLVIPIPASITVDWFSPHRSILLWPIFIIFTSIGFANLLSWFLKQHKNKKYLLFVPLAIFTFLNLKNIESVIIYHPYVHAGSYQYGFADTVPFVKSVQDKYDQVIIDSPHAQPYIFFLFYTQYSPQVYQQETLWRQNDHSRRKTIDFGKYVFRKIYWPSDRNIKNTLFIGNSFSLPYDQLKDTPQIDLLKEFVAPDGNITFRVVGTK